MALFSLNEMTVGIAGFVTIVLIVVTLFKTKTVPAIAFVVFPVLLAIFLVLGGYYDFDQIASLIKSGFSSTAPTAAMFVFSVLFFGIMSDAGMFDVIIKALMRLVGGSPVGVTVLTCIIALIGHLDGGGASTFCIVIPAMLPIYKKMNMRTTTLLRVSVLAMGILNLMPWAGPTMRCATVLDMEASTLWAQILPAQVFGIVICFANAILAGFQEKKRGAGLKQGGKLEFEYSAEETELQRPKLFVFNILLTIAVIALLILDMFPSYLCFMIGVSIAILVNYPALKLQKKVINLHAQSALMMCSTLFGAGVLMGILVKSVTIGKGADAVEIASVVTCMADLIKMILPQFLGEHLPIVIGILSTPLAIAFDTDSYFFGMLPVMIGIGNSFGIDPTAVGIAMVIGRNCATFISPMVPATLLGLGLADVEIKDHLKHSFGYVWAMSILCMLFCVIIGIFPL